MIRSISIAENKTEINETQRKLLEYLSRSPRITGMELAQILGVSQRSIEKNIKILKEKGLVVRHGSTKSGYWEVEMTD